ncbi:MAG TPA: hypothetical protein VFG74_03550 [Miltoncostaeaceae bacterium]|nr:hypothetical protein [Miltoncostaeaceae bacterium]
METETETTRRIDIAAEPDEVWEALTTDEGRERWLEDDPGREIVVESEDAPSRLVWWWWRDDEAPTRVEFLVVPVETGTRVVVTERAPSVPLARLARACARGGALVAA